MRNSFEYGCKLAGRGKKTYQPRVAWIRQMPRKWIDKADAVPLDDPRRQARPLRVWNLCGNEDLPRSTPFVQFATCFGLESVIANLKEQ